MKKLLLLAIITATTVFGCKKKETTGADDKSGSAGSATAPAPAPVPPPAGSAEAPAPATGGITSSGDYKAKATPLLKQMMDVFSETNCDKLAAKILGFVDAHKAETADIDAWEKAHPEDKAAFEKDTAAMQKDFEKQATPTIEKCKNNKALQDAMAKLPQG